MKIIAQSQTPTSVSYIHLAYISAALDNRISRGDLLPMEAFLGIALAVAAAAGAIGARTGGKQARVRRIKIGAVVGFVGALCILWLIQAAWRDERSNEDVVQHVIRTRQFWAMREPPIAAGVEATASTNGTAASLAATYYGMKRHRDAPEMTVKGFRYCEIAAAMGQESWLIRTNYFQVEHPVEEFKAALAGGKLSPAERAWARQKLAELDEPLPEAKPATAK